MVSNRYLLVFGQTLDLSNEVVPHSFHGLYRVLCVGQTAAPSLDHTQAHTCMEVVTMTTTTSEAVVPPTTAVSLLQLRADWGVTVASAFKKAR